MTGSSQIIPENYLDLWDVCPNAVLIITEKKEIVFANSKAAELFDYSREEIIGTPLNRIISGELPGFKEGLLAAAPEREGLFKRQQLKAKPKAVGRRPKAEGARTGRPAQGGPQGKIEGIRKNSARFPIELSLSMYRGNEGTQLTLAILRDLTLEKKEETRQRRVNETLYAVAQVIGSTLELDDVLQRILGQLKMVIDYQAAAIMLVDEQHKNLYVKVTEGFNEEAEKISLPLDGERGVSVQVVRTGEPQYVPDIAKNERHVSGGINQGSELAVPLKIKDEVIGVLNLESEVINAFSRQDLQLLTAFAGQAGIAIENARLFKDLNEEKGRLELLYEISSHFTSDLELEQMLTGIIERITAELGGLIGHFFTLEPDGKRLRLHAVAGVKAAAAVIDWKLKLCLGQGLAGWVALHRKPAVVPDVQKDSRWHYVDEIDREVHAAISVPLFLGEKTIGVISILHSEAGYFDDPVYLRLLTAISNQVAVTIEKASLYKQLKESEGRFRSVTANTGDWVWEVDADGRYTYSSPVVAQILGYTPKEVLAKRFYDFFMPEDREKLKSEAFKAFQMRKSFTALINRNLHKDGHIVILETSGTPVIAPDGEFTGYRGVDHDITTRLQAEQAFASSEHKYRILVEHTNDWIWTLDLKGNFTFFNRAAEEASGYRYEEWVGKSFVPIILPEDLPDVNKVYSEILAGNSKSYEVRVFNREGKLLTLAVNTAPLYEGASSIVGTVSMGRDVTRQKRLEDQLRQAQKMEAIGTLAGGIAHDFNNILGGILGYTSLIKTEIPENNPLRTELDAVISLVRRAAELTGKLLGFARGGRYQVEPINLNNIIDEVLELLSRTIDKAICIKPVLNPALAAIEGDAGQIQQMILNLCLNARDAMPGGGELLIETENINIDEDSAGGFLGLEAGSYVLLSVSDTGSGMDSETKERIFEPFFTTKAGKGNKHSGLGLSMVYGIVHSHGGIIKIYSEVGEGTTFKVYLPATERKVIKKERQEKTPVGGKETILVVDDEELILKPAERILERAGYKVLTADGGSKALGLFSKYHKEIDLVILDMIMPDMNGTATYKGLKQIDPGLKVILSSGYSRNGQAQELLNSGVKDFLQKPYEFADMLIKVRQVLDRE